MGRRPARRRSSPGSDPRDQPSRQRGPDRRRRSEGVPFSIETGHETWSDADGIGVVGDGIACGMISIPLRYMHSAGRDRATVGHRCHVDADRGIRAIARREYVLPPLRAVTGFSLSPGLDAGTLETMSRSVIVAAVRTPFGRFGGGLAKHPATELGADGDQGGPRAVGDRARGGRLRRHGPGAPGRRRPGARPTGGHRRGIPKEVPADTINKVCASSIRAIELADLMIRAGQHEVVVTGGMESMSNAPYLLPKARFGYKLGNGECSITRCSTVSRPRSTAFTWCSRRRSSHASSASPARSRMPGPCARTLALRPRRTRAGSTTRSSQSATLPSTRACGATRRARSSPR